MSKHIEFLPPVDYATGNISGRQALQYGEGGRAYEQQTGQRTESSNYEPRLIAKRLHAHTRFARSYFQVRTKTTVNMTDNVRMNLAVMGGAGALFASLLRNKSAQIYLQCIAAKPKNYTLRQFVVPVLMAALSDKDETAVIASGIEIINPWVSFDTPNVPVTQSILDKFAVLRSN